MPLSLFRFSWCWWKQYRLCFFDKRSRNKTVRRPPNFPLGLMPYALLLVTLYYIDFICCNFHLIMKMELWNGKFFFSYWNSICLCHFNKRYWKFINGQRRFSVKNKKRNRIWKKYAKLISIEMNENIFHVWFSVWHMCFSWLNWLNCAYQFLYYK